MIHPSLPRSRYRWPSLTALVWILAAVVWAQGPGAPGTPVIIAPDPIGTSVFQNVQVSAASVARYSKIEWTFDLTESYPNPDYFYDASDTPAVNPATMTWFGEDGVTVNLNVTPPSGAGNAYVVPCFYQVGVVRDRFPQAGDDWEILARNGDDHWTCRDAPREVGIHTYYLTSTDAGGTERFPATGTITYVSTASGNRGFIRQSATDKKYFAFDDGSSWVPISAARQWNDGIDRSYDYEDALTEFGAEGVNFFRLWTTTDFSFAVEGSGPPIWNSYNTVSGAAQGFEVDTANVDQGLRSAHPATGTGGYQRLVVSSPASTHRLTARIKTSVATGCPVRVRGDYGFNAGAQYGEVTQTGTVDWATYTTTFSLSADASVSVSYLPTGSGDCYFDAIQFGPDDGAGGVTYNLLLDPDFERHFYSGNPGNDPDGTPTLPRPIGNWVNPWGAEQMDVIIEAAEAAGVKIQVCTCSGPWFTWPDNPAEMVEADFDEAWLLRSYQRNTRQYIARWGYSTAVLAWEFANEQGHINPSGTPNAWAFNASLIAYQHTTDPFDHFVTTSQNSGAFSPQLWADQHDLANSHWYIDGHNETLDPDDVATHMRFAYCLTRYTSGADTACTGLGLGDGTSWTGGTGNAKPWIFGEFGIFTTMEAGVTGEEGCRFHSNRIWSGLFSPAISTGIDWWFWMTDADSTAKTCKFNATSAAAAFFEGVDIHKAGLSWIVTADEQPPGYSGDTVTTSTATARAYVLRRSDQTGALGFVNHQDYIWSNAGAGEPSSISPTITIPGLLANQVYRYEVWNTETGVIATADDVTANGSGAVAIPIGAMTRNRAFKVTLAEWPQFQANAQREGRVPEQMAAAPYALVCAWVGPTTASTSLPLSGNAGVTIASRAQPIIAKGNVYIGTQQGTAYARDKDDCTSVWSASISGGTAASAAVGYNVAVFTSVSGLVYGFNATTGAAVWSYDTGFPLTNAPLIQDTRVFVANHRGDVYAFRIDTGELLWTVRLDAPIEGELAGDVDRVYVGTESMYVFGLNATTGATVGSVRVYGRSFKNTHPLVYNGKLWITSNLGPSGGAEYISDDVVASSGAGFSTEETNIGLYLDGNTNGGAWPLASRDWRSQFAINVPAMTLAFHALALPVHGSGVPPPSLVVDNTGGILAFFRTRFPTFTDKSGSVFGTDWDIDLARINQSTGARTRIEGLTNCEGFPWEVDNLGATSVGGNLIYFTQRFRGVQACDLANGGGSIKVVAHVDNEDGGDFGGAGYLTLKDNEPRIGSPDPEFEGDVPVSIAGTQLCVSENFGFVCLQ